MPDAARRRLSQRPAKMDRMPVEAARRRATHSSATSTTNSARPSWPPAVRCACWPARAPARPAPSPAASPTSWRRDTSRRDQVLAVTFTQRAAGEMRGRLRALDDGRRHRLGAGDDVSRRGPPPAAVLLAARRRRHRMAAARHQVRGRRPGRQPRGAADQHRRRARPRRRNRMGQGISDQPGGLRRRRRAGRPRHPVRRREGRDGLRRLRIAQGPPRRHGAARLRRSAAAHRRRDRERRRGRPGVPRPLPLLRRRRVPGRHPAAAAGARRVARRAATT